MSYNPMISISNSEDELVLHLSNVIEDISRSAIEKKNQFTIGLSGGSTLDYTVRALDVIKSDWTKWIVFFCDERVVPTDHPDSTFATYKKKLGDKNIFKDDQIVSIKYSVIADDVAKDYVAKIKTYFPESKLPKFDLLLLGMGPDGHTASLFPNHPILKESSSWVVSVTNSPKPPPMRITLTLPVINNANCCVFTVCGKEKAEIVKQILKDGVSLPARLVQPTEGELHWFLDRMAASQL